MSENALPFHAEVQSLQRTSNFRSLPSLMQTALKFLDVKNQFFFLFFLCSLRLCVRFIWDATEKYVIFTLKVKSALTDVHVRWYNNCMNTRILSKKLKVYVAEAKRKYEV